MDTNEKTHKIALKIAQILREDSNDFEVKLHLNCQDDYGVTDTIELVRADGSQPYGCEQIWINIFISD